MKQRLWVVGGSMVVVFILIFVSFVSVANAQLLDISKERTNSVQQVVNKFIENNWFGKILGYIYYFIWLIYSYFFGP